MRAGYKNLFAIAAAAALSAWGKPMRPSMEGLDLDMLDLLGGNDRRGISRKYAPTNSRYYPHQGPQERERRRRQMAKAAAKNQ